MLGARSLKTVKTLTSPWGEVSVFFLALGDRLGKSCTAFARATHTTLGGYGSKIIKKQKVDGEVGQHLGARK